MNATGDVLYESLDNIVINNSLVYNSGVLSFTEYNTETNEYTENTVPINNRIAVSTNYYD